jgi:hypothetical protein
MAKVCRTCGFTDCPGANSGSCGRWPDYGHCAGYTPTHEEITGRAAAALSDHKAGCPRCGDIERQMCEIGLGLRDDLWDCRARQDEVQEWAELSLPASLGIWPAADWAVSTATRPKRLTDG